MPEPLRTACSFLALLGFLLAPVNLRAADLDTWIPARWDGGPLEVSRRADDKALAEPGVREAIAEWYNPATLKLLESTPVNCLLLTFSSGADAGLEKQQQQLVSEYAVAAREHGLTVLGLVYPGAHPTAVASAASEASLDGLVLDGEFPDIAEFAGQLEEALRSNQSAAVVIPIASSELLRKTRWPVLAIEGVVPGVGELSDVATASATGGLWIDSNMWLVRSRRHAAGGPPVWITQSQPPDSAEGYVRRVAEAAAAGGRWVVSLDDGLRSRLHSGDAAALSEWRSVADSLAFFEEHAAWRSLAPFGAVGIILDPTGPNLANSEEYLNLVGRRRIPYRVIERSEVSTEALAGLRAVLAFDVDPPTDAERQTLLSFAEEGGLLLGGPSWGEPPAEQSYAIAAAGRGEVAVYQDSSPDPESVARDLHDLVPAPELGLSFNNAPSVLSYVSRNEGGEGLLIHFVNYADLPAEQLSVSITGRYRGARLYVPGSEPAAVGARSRGGETRIAVPPFPVYGALLVE